MKNLPREVPSLICAMMILFITVLSVHAQEISVHKMGRDTVWYKNVDEKNKPDPVSCEANGVNFYRVKLSETHFSQLGAKTEIIKTDKENWTEEDDKELEKKYNEEHAEELDKMLDEYDEERYEIPELSEDFMEHFLRSWFTEDYNYCIPDCKSQIQECHYSYEITWLKDSKVSYRYQVSSSWHEEKVPPPHEVEIEWDLYVDYECWIYFKIACVCLDAYVSAEPASPENILAIWEPIDLTDPKMKDGYPFITEKVPFPWVIASGSVAGVGTLIYFLFKNDEGPADCAFSATAITESASCGLANGNITVTTSPAVAYTYAWSNGATTQSLSGVAPGQYSVTITRNGTSCSEVLSAAVANTNIDLQETITTTPADCGQNDGSATIDILPAIPSITYTWSNGGFGSSQSNLAAGAYTVTVSAGGACTEVYNITVSELPPAFEVTILPTAASCGNADGSALVVATPKGSYEYIWSNGQTGEALTDVAAGEYTVTVSIAGTTCQKVVTVDIGELPPSFDVSFNVNRADCGEANGSVSAEVVPSGNYEFLWSNGMTTNTITDIAAGTYGLTVTLAGTNCSLTYTVEVPEELPVFTINFNTTQSSCDMADGTAEAIIDPPGTYEFLWSNGMTTQQITGLAPGQYMVTVTIPGTSCSLSASTEVTQVPVNFTISISTTPADCGIANGVATATVDPAGTYTYQWPNGSTEPFATGLFAGSYVLTVTDDNGCMSSGAFTVSENPALFIPNISSIPGNCLGEGADILVTAQSPGAGPMEIVANGPDGQHIFTAPPGVINLSNFFAVLPGSWEIIIRDVSLAATCQDTATITVEDNTSLVVQNDFYETTTDQPVNGNVLTNDTGLNLIVTEHTEPAGGTLTLNADGTFTFTPPAGVTGQFSFQYSVTDTCGNTAIATVTINVNSLDCLFDATFSVTDANCGIMNGSVFTVVTPPGNYSFLWSNGVITQDLTNVSSGQYTVTITSIDLNCNKSYAVDVMQLVNTYITGISTEPGNCTGEGEITLTLTTPGSGPLVVTVTGPEGTQQFTLAEGTHNLSSLMNIPSGDYTITVYDQGAGDQCSETIDVTVADNSPDLNLQDDDYETEFQMPVSDNVLDNDSGLNLSVTAIMDIEGGMVTFNADGSFTYLPDQGFSGFGSFVYTVTDACGNTGTALVEIFVMEVNCDFSVQFINTNASCGFEDGMAVAIIDPPGTYFYEWSNGDVGPEIENVAAGIYTVTIEDVNLGCSLEFETEVGENPAEYISNIQVIQPVGTSPGEIRFDVSSLGGGPFEVTVTYPEGTEVFTVPEGTVNLSDHVAVFPGTYIISVIDVNAGPDCVDGFEVEIEEGTVMELGMGVAAMSLNPALIPEQSQSGYEQVVTSFIDVGVHYRLGGIRHRGGIGLYKLTLNDSRVQGKPGLSIGKSGELRTIMASRISHHVEMWRGNIKDIKLRALGGLTVDMVHGDVLNRSWEVGGVASWRREKFGRMEMVMKVRGWERIEGVEMGVGVRMGVR